MKSEDSLPRSQEPTTRPYSESCCTKGSVQARGSCERFVARPVFTVRSCQHLAQTPQAGGPPLVGCPLLLIQYIRSCRLYWRLFLPPEPEDALWHGDRDPLIKVWTQS